MQIFIFKALPLRNNERKQDKSYCACRTVASIALRSGTDRRFCDNGLDSYVKLAFPQSLFTAQHNTY